MSVPAYWHGLPPAVVRLKGRIAREFERAEERRLRGALDALVQNQNALKAMVESAGQHEQAVYN